MKVPEPLKNRCHVLLVDDHAAIRTGLRNLLAFYDDIEIVGEAGDGIQAVELADACCPEVVVMDINMPKMNGLEATEHIKRFRPRTVVVGMTVDRTETNHNAMVQAGAVACLEKANAFDDLYPAIMKYCQHA